MTAEPKKRPPKPPTTGSGEHEAVRAVRDKLDSIQDTTIPKLEAVNERLDKIASGSSRPPNKDPRREDDGPIPVDVVDLEEEPETKKEPKNG